MKKSIIILLIVVIVVVIFLVSLLSNRDKGIEVYQYTVEKRDLMSIVSASGIIEPRVKVNISSNVIGEIVKLAVKEGQTVNKGDFLLQIDPQQYEAEVRRLKAYLKMSEIKVEQAEVNLRDARNNLERVKSLFQKEFVSQMELEAAQVKYDSAEVQLKSAREEVAQARASLERVEDQLDKTTFTAPMSGIVSKLNAEEGETVVTGTMNNPGTVIMTIADMSEVLSTVNVDETEITKVSLTQRATVTVDAVEGKEYQGEVVDIATSATKEGDVSVFEVKVALETPDQN
ncbi:MAG: efflux RND transporter periplasmic adaptor subunit, partial [Acidobacteriota bacterium]